MPAVYQAAGRIIGIQKNSSGPCEITLLRNQKMTTCVFDQWPPYAEFLQEGDLVAVVSKAEIILLAPQLKVLPNRSFSPGLLENWNLYLGFIREFFTEREFLEVRTPTLVSCPGTEPTLDVFSTELQIGSKKRKLFLPTSPELHLKKALALGADKIFELANCFRNGEITLRHQPEFMMLEWYRAYSNLGDIKKDVIEMVHYLADKFAVSAPRQVLSYSVADLFKIYCDFDLTPLTTAEQLKNLAARLQVDVHSAESVDDLFFLIFMDKIETRLDGQDLIFVEKYPPYQAALARLTDDGWGDRFEVYWQGYELANAFHELNHPEIQRERSLEDLEKKAKMQKEEIGLDQEFFDCLEAGMPPSGGIALGVERLFMCLFGVADISALKLFPLK